MVTKKPKGLGRGLEALLGPQVVEGGTGAGGDGAPHTLRLEQLRPGKYQPRTRMDEGSLFELAESIKAQGIMQAILVRPVEAGDRPAGEAGGADAGSGGPFGSGGEGLPAFEIIAGERRFRAAKLAGLDEVPVLVRDVPDQAAAAMALIENIQREDLNPLEEAQGVQRLIGEFGLTHDQAAQAIGRSRSATSNLLRLLQLAEPVQQMLMSGELDMGHARALLALDRAHQITNAMQIAARRLSVREAEKLVARAEAGARSKPQARGKAEKPRDLLRLEEELSDQFTATVEIRVKKRTKRGEQGEMAINFASLDELNALIERLRRAR
jgi:ParB family chromosome partitioning protein